MGGRAVLGESLMCIVHGSAFKRFADDELLKRFGIKTVYFCPVPECDIFEYGTKLTDVILHYEILLLKKIDSDFVYEHADLVLGRTLHEVVSILAKDIIQNAVRLKVLFKKQKTLQYNNAVL